MQKPPRDGYGEMGPAPVPAAVERKPRSRWDSGLPAVTPKRIVDEALLLTRTSGLERWTIRALAAAVDAYPTVIYHHVGDRDAVVDAVVGRVVALLPIPPAGLPWRDWHRVLLGQFRVTLRDYPGVSRRLAVQGPAVPETRPMIERGVSLLRSAGLGDESMMAFSYLFSTACQFVALYDDREFDSGVRARPTEPEGPDVVDPGTSEMDGVDEMGGIDAFIAQVSRNPGEREGFYASFYDYAVERALDGVEMRLAARMATRSPRA